MIVKFNPAGRSFKWLATYLTHDPKAETDQRVAWTHTLNLAHDDAGSAVHEMLRTFENRELLKAEAGIRAGGAQLEKPVLHVSLSWHPSERVSQKEMIAAAQSFLEKMGWEDHQCLIVAHRDRPFQHVHLMINAVHPEKGTRLKDSYAYRRAQAWALGYERDRGQVFCEERLKPAAEREASPPRPAWEVLRTLTVGQATSEPGSEDASASSWGPVPSNPRDREWRVLRAQQRADRLAFVEEGRQALRDMRKATYREVRQTYRAEWRAYYGLCRQGIDPTQLVALRADLVARQRADLEMRCALAAAEMKTNREVNYRFLLDGQQLARADLADRQERGVPSPDLWHDRPTAAPPGRAQTAPHEPAVEPTMPHEAPLAWTHRAGMVQQQRSAEHWLRRARRQHERSDSQHASNDYNPLRAAADRIRREASAPRRGQRQSVEPER